jgi:hypothetical protein
VNIGETPTDKLRPHALRAEPQTLRRLRAAIMFQSISFQGLVIDRGVLLTLDLAVPRGEVHAFDGSGGLIGQYRLPEHLL